jgi:hypothetical protein
LHVPDWHVSEDLELPQTKGVARTGRMQPSTWGLMQCQRKQSAHAYVTGQFCMGLAHAWHLHDSAGRRLAASGMKYGSPQHIDPATACHAELASILLSLTAIACADCMVQAVLVTSAMSNEAI